ncbi:MAG TPA: 4-(cytidine 5'-diphospho)-2-C-methyl-D-erythritol kinase [Stellaceae bacterium]|jgi:4-diphosphocytidyl-2-C-methyl-D-erythritol kinase|nr:4-(cytidine 5'-diphospho)-2-C-methyl-D-erythritol kinase [Stellaceae bacterium]
MAADPRWWPAPAKLNLYLHVTGRRADGFHLLDSLVAFSDIGDRLSVAPAPRLSLAITGPFAHDLAQDDAQKNLVWRAAEALAAKLSRAPDVALTLEKNLPVASGIGGGSSDAAAALKALAVHWQASIDERALCAIAATLGADVPVCVVARASFFGGIGDEIAAAPPLPHAPLLLVNPGIALPTASVFRARQGAYSAASRFASAPTSVADLAAILKERHNDLTDAAIGIVPAVGEVLTRLAAQPGALLARMSGSGATCFALFETTAAAEAAAASLKMEQPRWWCAAGHLI